MWAWNEALWSRSSKGGCECVCWLTVDLRYRGGMKTRPMQPEKTGPQEATIRTIGFPYGHYPQRVEFKLQNSFIFTLISVDTLLLFSLEDNENQQQKKKKKTQHRHNYKYKVLCRLPSTEYMLKKKKSHFSHLQNKKQTGRLASISIPFMGEASKLTEVRRCAPFYTHKF